MARTVLEEWVELFNRVFTGRAQEFDVPVFTLVVAPLVALAVAPVVVPIAEAELKKRGVI